MTDKAENEKAEDNQELHAMVRACGLLNAAAVELALANLPVASRVIRNSALNLTTSIDAARKAAEVARMKDLLVFSDRQLRARQSQLRETANAGTFGNFPAGVDGGGGSTSRPSAGEGIYSVEVPEKKSAASGGIEIVGAAAEKS